MLGTCNTALFLAAISVYIFHDVDQDRIGHWNAAFVDLSIEVFVLSLILGGAVWLLARAGQRVFGLRGGSPRARIGLSLGIAAAVFQYPFDFLARKLVPSLAQFLLSI
jgi:hypothetical protein